MQLNGAKPRQFLMVQNPFLGSFTGLHTQPQPTNKGILKQIDQSFSENKLCAHDVWTLGRSWMTKAARIVYKCGEAALTKTNGHCYLLVFASVYSSCVYSECKLLLPPMPRLDQGEHFVVKNYILVGLPMLGTFLQNLNFSLAEEKKSYASSWMDLKCVHYLKLINYY